MRWTSRSRPHRPSAQNDDRRQWAIGWLRDVPSDAALAMRGALQSPAVYVIAVVTLALGIGASTAMFSVVNGILLRPLPYPHAERLVALTHTMPGTGTDSTPLSPALYRTFSEHSRLLESIGLWRSVTGTVTGLAEPEHVSAIEVTESLLPLLGIRPTIGRGFTADDTGTTGTSPVILSNGYWRSRFGATPNILGRTLRLDGVERQVVGVMPPGVRIQDESPDLFLPTRLDKTSQGVGNWSFPGIARLRPGVDAEQVSRELSALTPLACELYPGIPLAELEARGFATVATPLKAAVIGDTATVLWVVLGAVGLVFLLACANVASLLQVKAEGRAQDAAVRTALGASWARLARQSVTESTLIGLVGGGAGLVLAYGAIQFLVRLAPPMLPRLQDVRLDAATISFATLAAVSAGVVFGLLPTIGFQRESLAALLRSGSAGAGHGARLIRTQRVFAIFQVAMAVVVLSGAGLMVRTFVALTEVSPGYQRPEDVITFRIAIPLSEAPSADDAGRMHHQIVDRLSRIPGVTSVSAAASVAMEDKEAIESASMEDFPTVPGTPEPLRRLNWTAPGYFETMENPLAAGRGFEWRDVIAHRHVAVVSQAFAREYWATPREALGKRFRMADYQPWQEIIGVAGDVHSEGVTKVAPPIIYFPIVMEGLWGRNPRAERNLRYVVRTDRSRDPGLLREINAAVWEVNPGLPVANVRTLDNIFAASIARTSFTLLVLGTAALVAVGLGMVGIYGLISWVVSRRTREIGIRMALGATNRQVGLMVLRYAAGIASAGLAAGLVVSAGTTRLLASSLFGVSPLDPATFGAVSALLFAIVLLAVHVPARRAAGLDPSDALRQR